MKLPNWISNFGSTEPSLTETEESFLKNWREWAFRVLALLIVLMTIVSLSESFHGLYEWFALHGVGGNWGYVAPIAIDFAMVIGELAIFAALTGRWHPKKRIVPWTSVFLGFGASVAGNIGHVYAHHPLPWDLTALVFPVSAAFGILIGFSVLKSLAAEKASKALQKRTLMAEVIENKSDKALDDQRLKGIDVLIPPRSAQLPPAPVPVSEDGSNTTTEWRGFPDGAQRLRRADLQTTIRNTGSFPAVQ